MLKPAELTPLTALELERIALEAGLPGGRAERRRRAGERVREAAGRAPGRREDRVHGLDRGRAGIAAGAAGTIKRVTLELGGKSANMVFADADLERRPRPPPVARVRERRPGLLRALAHPRRALGAGSASWRRSRTRCDGDARRRPAGRARPQMGPLISADQRETVASYVDRRRAGRDPRLGARGPGYWFPPTVLVPGLERRSRRARGDLRPGRLRDPVRGRGGGGADRERHDLWSVRLDLDPRRRAGAARRARDRHRRALDQLEQLGARRRRRSAASSSPASGASSGPTRSSTTPTSRTSSTRRRS